MFSKPLERIELSDLESLIANGVTEGIHLDYKRALPNNDDESKKEFLKDVSAMANTAGGDIVYGVMEMKEHLQDDAPDYEIAGITGEDVDARKLWVENLVRDAIEPRLTGIGFHVVSVDEVRKIFIVRVPQSWNGPHVINFKKHWRFYARNAAGNYPMDISQVREAFVFRESLSDKLEAFRNKRVQQIKEDPSLGGSAKLVLHMLPFDSIMPDTNIDIHAAVSDYRKIMLGGMDRNFPETRLNFDGLIAYFQTKERRDYLQIFRNGVTEEVDADMSRKNEESQSYINSLDFERTLIKATGRRLDLLKGAGIASPVMLYVSMLDVRSCRIKLEARGHVSSLIDETAEHSIDRDDLLVRGILIENLQNENLEGTHSKELGENKYVTAARIIRPAVDAVWNAAGCPRSLHYNANGDWTGLVEGY